MWVWVWVCACCSSRFTARFLLCLSPRQKQGKLPALQDLIVEESWKAVLSDEFEKDYFLKLERFLHCEQLGETPIYPPMECIFRALNSTPFEDVRVVILGQVGEGGPLSRPEAGSFLFCYCDCDHDDDCVFHDRVESLFRLPRPSGPVPRRKPGDRLEL